MCIRDSGIFGRPVFRPEVAVFEIVIFLFLFIIITNSLIKLSFNLTFSNFDLRLNLFSIILILFFCILGFCIYLYNFILNFFETAPSLISYTGNYSVYSFSENFFNLLGFLIVLIGWSLHKTQLTSSRKFLRILIFITPLYILLLVVNSKDNINRSAVYTGGALAIIFYPLVGTWSILISGILGGSLATYIFYKK